MLERSFNRFSWLTVFLVVCIKAIGLNFIWVPNNSHFCHQFTKSCILECPTTDDEPHIHIDALEDIKSCMAFINMNNTELLLKTQGIIKRIVGNPNFKVDCTSKESENSFRFTEVRSEQQPTYLVLVFDTSNCSLVRLENFCEFISNSTILQKSVLSKEES